jgi:16S rRNA (guanine966-N2)-methyltransferase
VRIVGGSARGRRLVGPPKGRATRPTSDKVREAIFDVLAAALPSGIQGHVVDIFAGTGALGIEALSRGAEHAVFIEQDPVALGVLQQNLRRAGFHERATVRNALAERALAAMRAERDGLFDLAFLDPPYGMDLAPRAIALLVGRGLLAPEGIVVIELGLRDPDPAPAGLACMRVKRYGDTRVIFLRRPFS